MKDKKLKRLSRAELLELLLEQTQETERLQQRLQEVEEQLAQRNLKIQEAGDLAHAVLAVNNVVEAAQQAARQYLDNIAEMEAQTKAKCEAMEAEMKAKCDALEQETTHKCRELIRDAKREAALIHAEADPDELTLNRLHQILDDIEE